MSALIEKKYYPVTIDPVSEIIEKYCTTCANRNCEDCVYNFVIRRDKEESMIRTGQRYLA
jgi:hypothetical protein